MCVICVVLFAATPSNQVNVKQLVAVHCSPPIEPHSHHEHKTQPNIVRVSTVIQIKAINVVSNNQHLLGE